MPGSIPKILIEFIKPVLARGGNGWAVLSGVLLAFAAPGYGLWPLAWVGLVPLWVALTYAKSWSSAVKLSGVFGLAYFGILFGWFWGLAPMTWLGVSEWGSWAMVMAGYLLVVLIQMVLVVAIGLGWFGLIRRGPRWAWLIAPGVWVLGMWLLNLHPLGLPWGYLAYSQASVDWVRQSVYGLGFYPLEALMVLCNLALAQAWVRLNPRYGFVSAGILLWVLLVGFVKNPPCLSAFPLEPLVIQPNITIAQERGGLRWTEKLAHYQSLLDRALAHPMFKSQRLKPSVVVLPESMMMLSGADGRLLLNPRGIPLLAGSIRWDALGAYNSVLLKTPDRKMLQWLDKRILVPFGETLPGIPEAWTEAIGIRFGAGYLTGSSVQEPLVLNLDRGYRVRLAPLVCFEALYPHLALQAKGKVDVLVTVANLGWYHGHPALESQFLAINQLRAAEVGLPLILATNTGLSALLDNQGKVLVRGESSRVGMLTQYGWQKF